MNQTGSKDWYTIFLVTIGALVGLLIIAGLVESISNYFSKPDVTPENQAATLKKECSDCITQEESGKQFIISPGSSITIELPEQMFPRAQLVWIANPSDSLKIPETLTAHQEGSWAIRLQAVKNGAAEIIVKSKSNSTSDFRISVVVQ